MPLAVALLALAPGFTLRAAVSRPVVSMRPGVARQAAIKSVFDLPEPAGNPSLFCQGKVAEPDDVTSVPGAVNWLSLKFPNQPFAVEYRSDTGYLPAKVDAPVLDLSMIKGIKTDTKCNSVKLDGGTTVAEFAEALSTLQVSCPSLHELLMLLPGDGKLPVLDAVLHKPNVRLVKAVDKVHVLDVGGEFKCKELADYKEGEEVLVSVILEGLPKLKPGKLLARWYVRRLNAAQLEATIFESLPDEATIKIFKSCRSPEPVVVIYVDGDTDLNLPEEEWQMIPAETPAKLWQQRNYLVQEAELDALTAEAVWELSQEERVPLIDQALKAFPARQAHLMLEISNREVRVFYDVDYPVEADMAIKEEKLTSKYVAREVMAKVCVSCTPRLLQATAASEEDLKKFTFIPGFKGEVYAGKRLTEKRNQYATSTFDTEMNPAIIAYPRDEEDVVLAIKYATSPDYEEKRKTLARPSGYPLKVLGRGGGHQYCGVSCDNDALILSMDYFKTLEVREVDLRGVTGPDGKPHDVKLEAHVGTGNRLLELATFFNQKGVTVPHGECPGVGIGGHSQTGGYGHILRNFGLCIDYVYGFTIVTADGTIRNVTRDSKSEADKDLYWAVLGGSPGAFGVTTHLIFHPILDSDYPRSTGWSVNIQYSKNRMQAYLEILEDFINQSDQLPEGLDLMMSLSTKPDNGPLASLFSKLHQSAILVELECRDMGTKDNPTAAYTEMKKIIEKVKSNFHLGVRSIGLNGEKHYPLSEMSLTFTRKPPAVTAKTKRENSRPYNKAAYGSKDKLKPGWSKAFADLCHDVHSTSADVHLIFQVLVGGGALQRNGLAELNSVSHRDAQLQSIVFDLFRGGDDEEMRHIQAAAEFQLRFEQEIVNQFQTAYPKVMAQWASHGDLDMNKKQVWEKYFDKPETYHKLRSIKKKVDPDDVFHSRFSIRPEP